MYLKLNLNLTKFGIWSENLSIDESIVPYYGRNSMKQFIERKPFRLQTLDLGQTEQISIKIYKGKEEVKLWGQVSEKNTIVSSLIFFFTWHVVNICTSTLIQPYGSLQPGCTYGGQICPSNDIVKQVLPPL